MANFDCLTKIRQMNGKILESTVWNEKKKVSPVKHCSELKQQLQIGNVWHFSLLASRMSFYRQYMFFIQLFCFISLFFEISISSFIERGKSRARWTRSAENASFCRALSLSCDSSMVLVPTGFSYLNQFSWSHAYGKRLNIFTEQAYLKISFQFVNIFLKSATFKEKALI